jgi:hypothetical protein
MLCFRLVFWGIVLVLALIPGFFLVGIIGRIAGFRPGSPPGAVEKVFGWFGIIVLGGTMLGICMCGGLFDWAITSAVENATPRPLEFNPTARPIPADWRDDNMERTWLSDIQEFNAQVGWGSFGKKGRLGYHLPNGDLVRVDGKHYSNSISMHPPNRGHSTVSYRLNREAKVFKAWAAYNDREHGWNPQTLATYVVLGDGVCLWAANPLQIGEMKTCRVNVEGVDVLELQVHCPGGHSNVRAVWVDPQILK